MSNVTLIFEHIEHIASIAAAVSIIYTAWIGRLQLGEWKKEKLFDRRAEHAEKIVKMIHRARGHINFARSRFSTQEDREAATEKLKERGYSDSEIDRNLIRIMVLNTKLWRKWEFFLEISNYAPIVNIIFDSSIKSELNQLVKVYEELRHKSYISSIRKIHNLDELAPLIRSFRREEQDDIQIEVDNIIERIESKIQEIMGTGDE